MSLVLTEEGEGGDAQAVSLSLDYSTLDCCLFAKEIRDFFSFFFFSLCIFSSLHSMRVDSVRELSFCMLLAWDAFPNQPSGKLHKAA
jgi:hypothetical protein